MSRFGGSPHLTLPGAVRLGSRRPSPVRGLFGLVAGIVLGGLMVLAYQQLTEPEPAKYIPMPPRDYLVDARQIDFYEELRLTPMTSGQAPPGWKVELRRDPPQRMTASIARDQAGMPVGGASQTLQNRGRELWGVIDYGVYHSASDAIAAFYDRRAEELRQYELAPAGDVRFFELKDGSRPSFCSRVVTPDVSVVDGLRCSVLVDNVVLLAEANGGDTTFSGSPTIKDVRALFGSGLEHLRRVRSD